MGVKIGIPYKTSAALENAGKIQFVPLIRLEQSLQERDKNKLTLLNVSDFKAFAGNGLFGKVQGHEIVAGSFEFISEKKSFQKAY